MTYLKIPCADTGEISDGYHTFDELYAHRSALFLALMRVLPGCAWAAKRHDGDEAFPGWFLAGMDLPRDGVRQAVTYHMPVELWSLAEATGAAIIERAPKWDGHTSNDVLERLKAWVRPNDQVERRTRLLKCCLKPEEITGDIETKNARVAELVELVNWRAKQILNGLDATPPN